MSGLNFEFMSHFHRLTALFLLLCVSGVCEMLSFGYGLYSQDTSHTYIYDIGIIGLWTLGNSFFGPYFAAYVSGKIGSLIYEV